MNERIYSFPPIADSNARILILGSMPSVASLDAAQYYAHPRNAFWRILFELFDEPFSSEYPVRRDLLLRHRIALWDSAGSCLRQGSLDSNITDPIPNNIPEFLREHPSVEHLYFNGQGSRKLFLRFYKPLLNNYATKLLPSTSPAAAMYSFEQKLEQWKCILDFL